MWEVEVWIQTIYKITTKTTLVARTDGNFGTCPLLLRRQNISVSSSLDKSGTNVCDGIIFTLILYRTYIKPHLILNIKCSIFRLTSRSRCIRVRIWLYGSVWVCTIQRVYVHLLVTAGQGYEYTDRTIVSKWFSLLTRLVSKSMIHYRYLIQYTVHCVYITYSSSYIVHRLCHMVEGYFILNVECADDCTEMFILYFTTVSIPFCVFDM